MDGRRKLNAEEIKNLAVTRNMGEMLGDDVESLNEYLGWTEDEMARWSATGELPH
jgi:hypothetical protein